MQIENESLPEIEESKVQRNEIFTASEGGSSDSKSKLLSVLPPFQIRGQKNLQSLGGIVFVLWKQVLSASP